jgi:hypothetical protein
MRGPGGHPEMYLACLLAIVACGDDVAANDRCLGTDVVRVTPEADTISVGDHLTYTAKLISSSCLPAEKIGAG